MLIRLSIYYQTVKYFDINQGKKTTAINDWHIKEANINLKFVQQLKRYP